MLAGLAWLRSNVWVTYIVDEVETLIALVDFILPGREYGNRDEIKTSDQRFSFPGKILNPFTNWKFFALKFGPIGNRS